jgi:hypothetical protein
VRNALDLDANAAAEEAARAEETSSAEERSAAPAAAAAAVVVAHAHVVRERAHVHCSRVDSYSYAVIQVRAAGGFVGAGDRGREAQGTTTREFAGVTRK